MLGTVFLWIGWLLFNGGSGMQITGKNGTIASLAITNSILSPTASGLMTYYIDQHFGISKGMRYNFTACTNGILAGLVSITAGSNQYDPSIAVVVGVIGSFVYTGANHLI